MLKEILKLINIIFSNDFVKSKFGTGGSLVCLICLFLIYSTVNNSLILKSLTSNEDECVMLSNLESKYLADLASKCNNSKNEQCFVSRWCLEEQKVANNFKSKRRRSNFCIENYLRKRRFDRREKKG